MSNITRRPHKHVSEQEFDMLKSLTNFYPMDSEVTKKTNRGKTVVALVRQAKNFVDYLRLVKERGEYYRNGKPTPKVPALPKPMPARPEKQLSLLDDSEMIKSNLELAKAIQANTQMMHDLKEATYSLMRVIQVRFPMLPGDATAKTASVKPQA